MTKGAHKGNKYSQKYTPQMIQDLCKSILEFAEEDGTVHFVEWSRRQQKSYSWLNRMCEDYPEFADAYKSSKELLAAKLVKTSIYGHPTNKNFNSVHAMEWKSVYSQEWKDYLKYKADIAKKDLSQQEIEAVVNIMDYSKAKYDKKGN